MIISDMRVLELGNTVSNFDYEMIKNIVARYMGKNNDRKTVYLEVLKINTHKQYMKDFLVVLSTQVAGETRILSVKYRKKPIFLNIANHLRKIFKGFIIVAKEVLDPPIQTETDIGFNTEIKEWMR